MKEELTKIRFTIPVSFNISNKNGIIFTKQAIENAINNMPTNIPILYVDSKNEFNDVVVGSIIENSHSVNCDYEKQTCEITCDGVLFKT